MAAARSDLQPRLRFLSNADKVFGPGKAELLDQIASTGSIRAAAEQMKMSYNRAWTLVREMNSIFRKPLVASARGGSEGGGAHLTDDGREVLKRYARMEQACLEATRADWQALRKLMR
jgi:molybdate transport system regulatory protein